MSGVVPQLLLVAVLIVVNAALSGAEMALVSLREPQLRRLEERSSAGRLLAHLAEDSNRFLATVQIGITLAGFLASAAAAVSLAEPLEEQLGGLGSAGRAVSIVLVTLALSYVTLVFGELAPKRLALQRAERWGLVMARPLSVLSTITRPAVWLLSHSTDVIVRLLGGDPERQRADMTEEDLRDMVAVQPTFTPEQRQIMDGAFEIAERSLAEIFVPRGDVLVLDAALSCREALRTLKGAGHSRAPVAADANLDDAIGVVHLRDLLEGGDRPVSAVVNELPVLPEQAKVLSALRYLQAGRQQFALVLNEHGAADGIVTVEDLVEELVGEIYDETDHDLETVRHDPDGSVVLPGRFPIHDLSDVGLDLPSGEYTTIAGLVLDRLGRIPDVGDRLVVEGREIEVRAMNGRAIAEVVVGPPPPAAESDESDDS